MAGRVDQRAGQIRGRQRQRSESSGCNREEWHCHAWPRMGRRGHGHEKRGAAAAVGGRGRQRRRAKVKCWDETSAAGTAGRHETGAAGTRDTGGGNARVVVKARRFISSGGATGGRESGAAAGGAARAAGAAGACDLPSGEGCRRLAGPPLTPCVGAWTAARHPGRWWAGT